jgi:beta-lactamase class A
MAWKKNNNPIKYKHSQMLLAFLLLGLLVVVGFIFWLVSNQLDKNQAAETTEITNTELNTQRAEETTTQNEFDSAELQSIIDNWVVEVGGTSSVVISDIDNNILAAHRSDEVYFAASIYKLYVAYAGYQQVDAGLVDPNELYVNGNTRAECLDLMIRDSDSPCAEKLWNEIGKIELNNQLKTYGIINTSMTGITTTAADAAIMLSRIERGEGLSDESRVAYLSSMKDQDALYRRGLPSGFSNAIVYNKVGWNELKEWHDTAIVEFPDGQKLIVSVFTENVGYSNISKLGSTIESALSP